MANQMSEKETFMNNWENEFKTTLKVLKAYPESNPDFKPHKRSRSAKELAWTFVVEEKMAVMGALTGKMDFNNLPKPPRSMKEAIENYEKSHKEAIGKIKKLPEKELNKTMKFFVAPKKIGDIRKLDVLWMILMDMIHHRGQFSVYLRMAGGKVPSIYGPSADEPWD
nr:hypothetical protein [Candidatus Woesearchaeota archaeon]